MKYSNKLFKTKKKDIYKLNNDLFFLAIKENVQFHYSHNKKYKEILDLQGFDINNNLKSYEDIKNIPFIPTLYFKHHNLLSLSKHKYIIKATSSGTSDINTSLIGLTLGDVFRGWHMVKNVFRYHHQWSLKAHRYIIFGYEPHKGNKKAVAMTAYGFTFLSPARSKDYAIKWTKNGYKVDLDNIGQKLIKYSKGRTPIRTLGFPAYTYFLLSQLKEKGLKITLPKGSSISLAGGWKSFYKEKIDKQSFYDLVYEVLGIEDKYVYEYFGAVEHPILYADDRNHKFHIPNYARVIIRDVETFEPLKNGEVGLVNLITPMLKGTPIISVMTDDLGIIHDDENDSPYLEILGRSGLDDVKTCAAGAEELLKNK